MCRTSSLNNLHENSWKIGVPDRRSHVRKIELLFDFDGLFLRLRSISVKVNYRKFLDRKGLLEGNFNLHNSQGLLIRKISRSRGAKERPSQSAAFEEIFKGSFCKFQDFFEEDLPEPKPPSLEILLFSSAEQ